ncbi:MAG: hypothetical protein AAB267_10390 [Candidatus Desantisbacteria bacterium]
MKIEGYFDYSFKPIAPFVDAVIQSERLGFTEEISFLIDTGASMTILLDKDVEITGLDVSRLKKADKPVGGIGGIIDTYIIDDAKIVFETDKGYTSQDLTLFVGVHNLSRANEETKRRILTMPSLLGREIVNEFDLHCLPQKGEIYLEKG